MPVLSDASRLDNIQPSIKAFVDAKLGTDLGLSVYFEGMGRSGTLPAQWVEIDTTDLSPQSATRSTSTGRRGVLAQHLIGANCFVHTDAIRAGTLSIFSLSTLANNVKQVFLPPASIPVYDYRAVNNPKVGSLISQRVDGVVDIDTTGQPFYQKNVSAVMYYISEWSVS